jgi:hypothetical protein
MGARAAPSACESVLRRQVEVVKGIGSSSRVAERGRVRRWGGACRTSPRSASSPGKV